MQVNGRTNRELDFDVATGRARVRADLVRLIDELLDLRVVESDLLKRSGVNLELDGKEEALRGTKGAVLAQAGASRTRAE